MGSPVRSNRGIEENTLAILDASGIRDSRDIHDDRLAFLEAVRLVSLTSNPSTAPTWNMYNAVFRIFRSGTSLEEIMASYQLLAELEKRYPRLYLVDQLKSESAFGGAHELVVVKETWLPFVGSVESSHADDVETSRSSDGLFDAHGFSFLTHEIAQAASALDFRITMKLLKHMLLFQYLVNVLEGDFLPRETVYKVTMKWVFLRESLLSLILGSRKINVRYFIQDCMTIISRGFFHHKRNRFHDIENGESSLAEVVDGSDLTLVYATLEMGTKTLIAVEKLLILVIHLDMHRKVADIQGYTSRADTIRVPLMEMIVDQLSYNKDAISPFFMAFSEPKWKLEIIVQYFSKYCHRSLVHTRRSSNSSDDATFEAILKYFSNGPSTKTLVRKMSSEIVQLLLAYGFQAYLSVRHNLGLLANIEETRKDDQLLQISKGLICAYENIKKNKDGIRISAFEKEALFTAATIVALDSQLF